MGTFAEMTKDRNKHRRHVVELVETIEAFLNALDGVMQGPSTEDRGKRIAALCNALELVKDSAKRFGLNKSISRRSKRVMEALSERQRAVRIIQRYLQFNDQRAVSWHEVQDCIEAIRSVEYEATQ